MKYSKITKFRHKNSISHTFSNMDTASKRILFMALSQIDSKSIIKKGEIFTISIDEYSQIAGVNKSLAYRQLKEAVISLQGALLEINKEEYLKPFVRSPSDLKKIHKDLTKNHNAKTLVLNITSMSFYDENQATANIVFNEYFEPYISLLKNEYTTLVLTSAVRLSDKNSSNLYQLFRKMFSLGKKSYFEISINDLKLELGLYKENKETGIIEYNYPLFSEFKRTVLNKSIKKLIENTEIKKIEIEYTKYIKRSPTHIKFTYEI